MTITYDWKGHSGTIFRDETPIGAVKMVRKYGGDWYAATLNDGRKGNGWTQMQAISAALLPTPPPGETQT